MKKSFLLSLALVALLAGFFAAPVLTIDIVLAAAALWIVADAARGFRRSRLMHAINTNPGNWGTHHSGKKTFLATAAIVTRYKCVKKGADAAHIAIPTATADEPIGVLMDEPANAEDEVVVELLGAVDKTIPMVAGAAILDGAAVYMGSTGSITPKPTAAGTYWKVGNASGAAAAAGDVIAVIPQKPRKLIVVAALTQAAGDIADTNSTAVNPTKADFDSLLVAAGKLQADFLVLSAALTGDADVTVATT